MAHSGKKKSDAIKRLNNGVSLAEISEDSGVKIPTLRKWLAEQGTVVIEEPVDDVAGLHTKLLTTISSLIKEMDDLRKGGTLEVKEICSLTEAVNKIHTAFFSNKQSGINIVNENNMSSTEVSMFKGVLKN